MLDLHCHILPGVDDGAADLDAAVAMARCLSAAGYDAVAPSPHFGEGPGGDVSREQAAAGRVQLAERLAAEGIELQLLPNAEHHVTMELLARIDRGEVQPIGGDGKWLLVELPWQPLTDPEGVLFRIQSKGYRLLLAHPERYRYLELDVIERLVERDVKMQLEIGSFISLYGKQAHFRALAMTDRGLSHVLASDMHRPDDAAAWLSGGLRAVADRYGKRAVQVGAADNPRALAGGALAADVHPFTEAR